MAENIETQVPSVYLSDIEKLIERIKKNTEQENVEVGFEFIIASLFPTSWNNIQTALSHQYTQGYIQGRKDAEEERKPIGFNGEDDADCYCV